ncbi:MAG: hypothetical protein K8H86_05920 [Ignavibacteriaceae bacterium]|nr:hypothetical protein [Ignavibacteriaceae bacterium]
MDFTSSQQGAPVYGYGLYKITSSSGDAYFYIDYRDRRIGRSDYAPPPLQGIDIAIKYDKINDEFLYKVFGASGDFVEIENGALKRFWEMEQAGPPVTDSFPNFWQNCLVVIPTGNNNPRLVWAPHPSINLDNYIIYRAISSTPLSHPEIYAVQIASVGSNVFEFIDYDVRFSGTSYLYYFVKGKYGSNYTNRTNVIDARGGLYKENLNEGVNIPDKLEVTNYPNPFNPVTSINYTVPENGFTELKVYNIYGQLI